MFVLQLFKRIWYLHVPAIIVVVMTLPLGDVAVALCFACGVKCLLVFIGWEGGAFTRFMSGHVCAVQTPRPLPVPLLFSGC